MPIMRGFLVGMFSLLVLGTACAPPTGDGWTLPPPAPTGMHAATGGGSGEVEVWWDSLPASSNVAFYNVYEQRSPQGTFWHLAVVTPAYLGAIQPGKMGIVDAPDYWPWPTLPATSTAPRCYVVTALSTGGREGPMSAKVCARPPHEGP
jgi:hypothetical protein